MGSLSFYMKKNLVFISLFLLFMCGCANLENFKFHEKVSIGTGFFINEKGNLRVERIVVVAAVGLALVGIFSRSRKD